MYLQALLIDAGQKVAFNLKFNRVFVLGKKCYLLIVQFVKTKEIVKVDNLIILK